MNLFQELKRRKVLKTLGVYGAAAMVITTTAATLFPFLLIPDWMVRFIIVLAILGIPITFFLSWTYDLKRDAQADDQFENADVIKDKKWSLTKKIIFPISGFILMAVGGIFWFIYPFLTLSLGDVREYDTSIAILYMENISPEKESYFAEGLTVDLINRLSRIRTLEVALRTDVAVYKDKKVSISEIAEELKVNYIVEGSVQIVGENLRVYANLFDILQEKTIWTNTYNRKLTDILEVQDEIAASIVANLDEKLSISKVDLDATRRNKTESLEAYNLYMEGVQEINNVINLGNNESKVIITLAEKALKLDSTYADAWVMLALGKTIQYKGKSVFETEAEIREEFNKANLFAEQALLYDPDNEGGMCLSILIPIAKMQTLYMRYSTKPDLFTIRRVKIMMDKYINRFSGSPLAYTTAGVFYMLRGLILNNNSDFDNALNNFLESHSIIKRSFSITYDPLQQVANQQNYEYIIDIYRMQGNYEKVYDFFQEVNYFKCNDDTYTCRSANDLNDLTFEFFFNNYYNGALEVNKIVLNRNEIELNLDDSDLMLANRISALMHMYRAEYDKAIKDIKNVFELPINDDIYKKWDHALSYAMLSEIYYFMGNYILASKYYLQYYQLRSTFDFDEHAHCFHAYIEELQGNSEKAKDGIVECVEWVKQNKDKIGLYHPYHVYFTCWPLYLYYDKLGQTHKASKYLQMAYEVVGKEKIEKYHKYPERDTHPDFFYYRDIIKAYESSQIQ